MLPNDPDPAAQPLNNLGHLSSAVGHHVINAFSAVVSSAEILRLKLSASATIDPATLADLIINTALEAATVARRLIDYTRPITTIGEESVLLHEVVAAYIAGKSDPSAPVPAPGSAVPPLRFVADLAPVPAVRGNVVHLHAMLDLLIDNAREAMPGPAGDPAVTFSTAVDGRGWVALEIRDNGQGMTQQTLERAVEPFFTTKAGRMGVGLSIANGIWRRHKGTLSLRSTPGDGTTLRLCVEPIGD